LKNLLTNKNGLAIIKTVQEAEPREEQ
jgi:hypothetical protein